MTLRGRMGRLIGAMHGRLRPVDDTDALHIAAFEGDCDAIRDLVTTRRVPVDTLRRTVMAAGEATPLKLAIQEGNHDAARLLIELGADIDRPSTSNMTPLMVAATGDPAMVGLLLSLGADPNAVRGKDGMTALHFATHAGDDAVAAEIVATLLAAGADPENPAEGRQSALMLAARHDLPAMIEALLAAGADPDRECGLKWAKGWTALDHAINEGRARAEAVLRPATTKAPVAVKGCVP